MHLRRVRPAIAAAVLLTLALTGLPGASAAPPAADYAASGFLLRKFPQPKLDPLPCTGVGTTAVSITRQDCGFADVAIAGTTATDTVKGQIFAPDGTTVLATEDATYDTDAKTWQIDVTPQDAWPAGRLAVRYKVGSVTAGGGGELFLNQLKVTAAPDAHAGGYHPGDPIPFTGKVSTQRDIGLSTQEADAGAATVTVKVTGPDGATLATLPSAVATSTGAFTGTIPGSATASLAPTAATDYKLGLGLSASATYTDTAPPLGPGDWAVKDSAAGSGTLVSLPTMPVLENSFVSSVGWVKPGEKYPFQLRVRNYTAAPFTNVTVTVPIPDGASYSTPAGTSVAGGALTWTIGSVPAAGAGGTPGLSQVTIEGTSDTLGADPKIVWKDLSSTAKLTYGGQDITNRSHGPKVIPPNGGYESARYGDRPFPVVPVAYSDRANTESASALDNVINAKSNVGSTFNLYQEMSYGQLFPQGTVPSDGVASAGWDYAPGFSFSHASTTPNTCHGITLADLPGTNTYQQLQPERIKDGWYQLPGTTDFYGDDANGSAVVGSAAGVGALMQIDAGCGPTAKSVYDAAQIADPDIDYSDYDTDKDGVVDFFMMIFAGAGGNGESQLDTSGVPYDNIWPHSSSLEYTYVDATTGLKGYVTDDQLKDLEGRPLWYTDETRTKTTTTDKGDALKDFVRVGPYNVNPESAIDKASVISHEYGHSLGLPDYYSISSNGRETYGDWMLMATDKSQNMDVVGKEELGWTIPRVLDASRTVTGWADTKKNIHSIDWKTPGGTPYTLSEGTGDTNVNNGEAYVANLPGRKLIDKVPSGTHAWFSGSGDNFGCAPEGGHNLDIALPGLESVPAGTDVTVSFKTRFDEEWDFDYGFVLTTTDGKSYTSHESNSGYTTPATNNPQMNPCQAQYGNGLTGTNGSYEAGTDLVDRNLGNYPDGGFTDDSYDLSDLAGQKGAVLRFSVSTDGGLSHPGWYIDDVVVKAADRTIYQSDFEATVDDAIYNGGCREGLQTAATCTDGWQNVTAGTESPAEHKYLMEMRDRSGFDFDSHGENDRDAIGFSAGLLLSYTDEYHGYGNVGTDDPPAQSPLDSQPEPENETPDLNDAAYTAATGDSSFTDAAATPHIDNYTDPGRESGQWTFDYDCLGFDVLSMTGDDVGPAIAPGNLVGDVKFTMGSGCSPFNYGASATAPEGVNAPPVAVAQAKPLTAKVGEDVSFDGSASSDDRQVPGDLLYAWDFGDGSAGATGQTARHAYGAAGAYTAKLTTKDGDGASATDTVKVAVTAKDAPASTTPGATATPGPTASPGPAGSPTATPGPTTTTRCRSTRGFRSVRVTRIGKGLRLSARRRGNRAFGVTVLRTTEGGRVLAKPVVVKRYSGLRDAVTWSPGALPDAVYVVRFRTGSDVRRVPVRRAQGRWRKPTRYQRATICGLLKSFRLSAPAFGSSLGVRVTTRRGARVSATVQSGKRRVRRLPAHTGKVYSAKFSGRGLPAGTYTVVVRIRSGGRTVVARLSSRRV